MVLDLAPLIRMRAAGLGAVAGEATKTHIKIIYDAHQASGGSTGCLLPRRVAANTSAHAGCWGGYYNFDVHFVAIMLGHKFSPAKT